MNTISNKNKLLNELLDITFNQVINKNKEYSNNTNVVKQKKVLQKRKLQDIEHNILDQQLLIKGLMTIPDTLSTNKRFKQIQLNYLPNYSIKSLQIASQELYIDVMLDFSKSDKILPI